MNDDSTHDNDLSIYNNVNNDLQKKNTKLKTRSFKMSAKTNESEKKEECSKARRINKYRRKILAKWID